MPYTYTWTPKTRNISASSKVIIRTWDGRTIPGVSYAINNGKIDLIVPQKNRYKVSLQTGALKETVTLDIPASEATPSLQERVNNLESGSSGVNGVAPDPDNEGFFIIL